MEVFAQLLNKNFLNGDIDYHPSANDPAISHLAFADDIMLFFDGEQSSLQQIAATLQSFASWSGLHMNRAKTELYLAGLSQTETADLASLGFSLGSLPVRYLGLPLMHRKLRICDYRPLMDQLKRRFSSWTSCALSFAGRRQLLNTVIAGTLNFWFSSFVLPKGCIKSIESLCSRFLWNGNITSKAAEKVSWNVVCLPRSEGGLGLRNLSIWNKTLSLKLVWLLHSESESLWASSTKHHRLKRLSIWSLDEKKQGSWIWKSILKLRPLTENFIRCEVGNGEQASFWFDFWLPIGPLINLLARSPQAEQLHIILCSVQPPSLSSVRDCYNWYVDDLYLDSFNTARTWESVRDRSSTVDWESVVWFGGHVPRHAFHMWVTHLDRLPTISRIAAWDHNVENSCLLCNAPDENRDHLFLRCRFSERLWKMIIRRLGYQPFLFHTWTSLIEWLRMKDYTCPQTLHKLAAHAVIYHLWLERNNHLHNAVFSSTDRIFKNIDRHIRNTILARRGRKKFHSLMCTGLRFS
ncbi:uncharacterized protein LOC125595072 [Brassica napus]|uniref:uncharacterized protein LOC106362894 n=1 Tax=Brassica napus TaxID=3708 RepID=UPI0006AA5FED|nr:uncharacterized protein LOC106362894 [Brassica napus]XP_048626984.1 uncharacterized protein LOC125595072 [Brassica napus]